VQPRCCAVPALLARRQHEVPVAQRLRVHVIVCRGRAS
jgi:hypothetical protein